jgi:hypothetical protein
MMAKPVVQTVVVEVRYRRGIVYLDRCGSLMLRLQDLLGPPFEPSIPQMDRADLLSSTERIVVRYGPAAFTVTQSWCNSPVRVEQIAPPSWEIIANALDVEGQVERCGVRFVQHWSVESTENGDERLGRTMLFGETEDWVSLFVRPTSRSFGAIGPRPGGGTLRASVGIVENKRMGSLSAELQTIIPLYAAELDLDYVHAGEGPYKLHKAGLKDFLRSSWEHARDSATSFGRRLGLKEVDEK